jgi:hypothetical protein
LCAGRHQDVVGRDLVRVFDAIEIFCDHRRLRGHVHGECHAMPFVDHHLGCALHSRRRPGRTRHLHAEEKVAVELLLKSKLMNEAKPGPVCQ